MDLCKYVRKNTLLATKGGGGVPYPLKSATATATVRFARKLLGGWNHLSVQRAGCHLRSVTLAVSVSLSFLYSRQTVPSGLVEMTLARYHPLGSSESCSSQKAHTYKLTFGTLGVSDVPEGYDT